MLLWLGDRSSYLAMLSAFVVIPLGMGLAVPAMTTSVLASVERERAGTGTAALNAARQTGGVIGVAAFGTLLEPSRIVGGMHAASLAAAGLLLSARWWRGGACQRPTQAPRRITPIAVTPRTAAALPRPHLSGLWASAPGRAGHLFTL